ncbi:MAG: PaaI family thioesterase [Pseudomonadales bacterium]|nr:PaaI family thioesterase [Pseudomonadales bacterium]
MDFPDGFETLVGMDPAEDYIGPFYFQKTEQKIRYAFMAEKQHCNAMGYVHGGVLMTFADYALCMEATTGYSEESCVTVSFNSEFISAGQIGNLHTCEVEMIKKTGSMVFLRGDVRSDGEVVLSFSAVVKRMRKDF